MKKKLKLALISVIHENVDALFSFLVFSHALYGCNIYTWCFIQKAELFSDLCNTWGQQCINGVRKFYLNLLSGYN